MGYPILQSKLITDPDVPEIFPSALLQGEGKRKECTWPFSFNSNLVRCILFSWLKKKRNWDSEKFYNLSKVTQLLREVEFESQIVTWMDSRSNLILTYIQVQAINEKHWCKETVLNHQRLQRIHWGKFTSHVKLDKNIIKFFFRYFCYFPQKFLTSGVTFGDTWLLFYDVTGEGIIID